MLGLEKKNFIIKWGKCLKMLVVNGAIQMASCWQYIDEKFIDYISILKAIFHLWPSLFPTVRELTEIDFIICFTH